MKLEVEVDNEAVVRGAVSHYLFASVYKQAYQRSLGQAEQALTTAADTGLN